MWAALTLLPRALARPSDRPPPERPDFEGLVRAPTVAPSPHADISFGNAHAHVHVLLLCVNRCESMLKFDRRLIRHASDSGLSVLRTSTSALPRRTPQHASPAGSSPPRPPPRPPPKPRARTPPPSFSTSARRLAASPPRLCRAKNERWKRFETTDGFAWHCSCSGRENPYGAIRIDSK